ncbi:unnamed protein product [Calicophoron daubneyi]|uniref:Purine nucleoside phosphorylase n=1 Tax=Calicophoron daubneyi TaxID=300641 RepID=A0AAV2THE2_CALDB
MSDTVAANFENVSEIAEFLKKKVDITPVVGIICGSGLGKLADAVTDSKVVKYEDIPKFPRSTVPGHAGNLVFGHIGDKPVVVMQGRFHLYEGYSRHSIALPVRVMKMLGVKILLVSNAAGGLNPKLKCGDFVVLNDHISIPGLAQNNVLIGPNEDKFGERFVPTSDAYSKKLRTLAQKIAKDHGFSQYMHEGVYAHASGPSYESPAECRMLKMLGADVVGMSTVPEVLIARHCGIEIFAISMVTNMSVLDVESRQVANHEEVLKTAELRAETMQKLFTEIVKLA